MMAIEAQMYADKFGFSFGGGSQNAYGFNEFSFNLQQKQQQQQHQLQNLQQQKTQSQCFDNNGLLSKHSNHQPTAFSQSIVGQIEKQGQQIDRFIGLQNERLRLALQEQTRQQLALILRRYEEKEAVSLKQKEEEIAKAMIRTMELEEFSRRMEIESQTWQRLAKENEAMVSSLSNTIEQLRENGCFTNGVVEDAESCCEVICRGDDGTGESRGQQGPQRENQEQSTTKMVCKSCNSWNSCVIFLPCRHLCSCKDCQAFLDSCPVCGMVKKASIEALI